jgi:hypothetical protein
VKKFDRKAFVLTDTVDELVKFVLSFRKFLNFLF